MRRLNQAGDTIIEVLIALTVVASMLGGAYITSNRSLNNNRQAQERGEALKLAEGQLERLKGLVSTGATTAFTTTGAFCVDASANIQTATPQACSVTTPGPEYYVTVERLANNQFSVSVSWDRVGGNGSDAISINYRLYPGGNTFVNTDPGPSPPPTPPTGDLTECTGTSSSTIRLRYTHSNTTNPTIWRGGTLLQAAGSSPGQLTDSGLSAGTGYVYYLRNGNTATSQALDVINCSTTSAALGDVNCSYVPFQGMTISYSHSNASSPSIWRGGSYIYNASATSGSFLDNDSSVMGTGNNITYYLRNGQSAGSDVLDQATCFSEIPAPIVFPPISLPPGICISGSCT